MKYLAAAFMFALISTTANAQCFGTDAFQTCTDSQSGNTYQIQRFGNTTQIYGSNPRTGSTWSQTTNKIGSATIQNGYDSRGNSWNTTRQDLETETSMCTGLTQAEIQLTKAVSTGLVINLPSSTVI
jgi:hypothetical protein